MLISAVFIIFGSGKAIVIFIFLSGVVPDADDEQERPMGFASMLDEVKAKKGKKGKKALKEEDDD
jgi:hypothetical protein